MRTWGIRPPGPMRGRVSRGWSPRWGWIMWASCWQRMWSGRMAKARRGELAVPLPAGFDRRPSGEVVLDPDEQVRAVVRLVFDLFERLGTIGAVLGFLADNRIQLGIRLREGTERGEL